MAIVLLAVVLAPACRRSGGLAGESTLEGAPASVPRFSTAPVIDGKLDDPGWKTATVLGPFVDTGNGRSVPTSHPVDATARIGWDEASLYLGFVVADGNPAAPFRRDDVDPHLWSSASAVEVMLQPGDPSDNRDYYEIQVDTAGAIFDTRWDDYMIPLSGGPSDRVFGHQDWSCGAERAVTVASGQSYTIEMALPWTKLASRRTSIPPRPGDVWRLNLYSFRDGQRVALGWSPIRGQGNFHKSSRFGRIRFQ